MDPNSIDDGITGTRMALLGKGSEGEPFEIAGTNPWGHEWHRLPGPAWVVDAACGTEHALEMYYILAPDGLVRFAAGEVSEGVYAFPEPLASRAVCTRCTDLRGEFPIRTPGELAKALRIARQNVGGGTIEERGATPRDRSV
jgi:hypothetical protein